MNTLFQEHSEGILSIFFLLLLFLQISPEGPSSWNSLQTELKLENLITVDEFKKNITKARSKVNQDVSVLLNILFSSGFKCLILIAVVSFCVFILHSLYLFCLHI